MKKKYLNLIQIYVVFIQIVKKIFGRANIREDVGHLKLHHQDLIKWEPFNLLNIDTFKVGNNNYMFKCIEIYKHTGLTPLVQKIKISDYILNN